ncbi:helix-turn-helix domain-containing protein [Pantoea agglomerans]|nr:helix-turn-helix domain-containing protein [Pantoea agglomerans]
MLRLSERKSISSLAREFNTTRQTIRRVKAAIKGADARS